MVDPKLAALQQVTTVEYAFVINDRKKVYIATKNSRKEICILAKIDRWQADYITICSMVKNMGVDAQTNYLPDILLEKCVALLNRSQNLRHCGTSQCCCLMVSVLTEETDEESEEETEKETNKETEEENDEESEDMAPTE